MQPRTLLATVAAALSLLAAAPAAASACAPGVNVRASVNNAQVGQPVTYSYSLCFASAPDRYDVQIYAIAVNGDGEITRESPVASTQGASLTSGAVSPTAGTGTFTARAAGDYLVRVRYYAAGKSMPESIGEATWRAVAPAPPVTPDPVKPEPVTPDPVTPERVEAKPEPEPATIAPAPAPVAQPTAPKPTVEPIPAPRAESIPEPQAAPRRAKLTLVKRAAGRVVRPGQTVRFRLTVRNRGKVAARNVRVCDRLPSATQYLGANARVNFKGRNACVNVGTLAKDKARTVTLRLRVDQGARAGRMVNTATATARNAKTARARATVKVAKVAPTPVAAPVTG